jgi:hypothetical protein
MNKTKNLTFISVKILHTINLNVHLHSENRRYYLSYIAGGN